MPTAHDFLVNLALVLCVAALIAVLFQRIRQPVVLGYILAGLVVGPHVPFPLVADPAVVSALSELGVILLMFGIGLEFRLSRLAAVAPTGGLIALIEVSAMATLGYLAGRALGWSGPESLFAGAIVSISSTSIIAKAFEEHPVDRSRRGLVFGVLIVEDLLAILMMAGLSILAAGRSPSPAELGVAALRLGATLSAMLGLGLLFIPRLFRHLMRLKRPETVVVAAVGICFALALSAYSLGYSVALGAFIAGMLIAESGHGHAIDELIRPLRDVLGAVFFVAVGMMINPSLLWEHRLSVVVMTAVVLGGKTLAVSGGAFLVGQGLRGSVAAGLSLAQIGEFSFIIAGLGLSSGVAGPQLYPVAVAVSAITAFTTPSFIRSADRAADRLDHALPAPLQTLSSLYASWLERARSRDVGPRRQRLRRLLGVLMADGLAIAALVACDSLFSPTLADWLEAHSPLPTPWGRVLLLGLALLAVARLSLTLWRGAHQLAELLLDSAEDLPLQSPSLRRSLAALLRFLVFLAVGAPVLLLTQPFVPPGSSALVLLLLQALLALLVWRRAAELQGELRSTAGRLFRAPPITALTSLDAPDRVLLGEGDAAVGQSLIGLNLRSRTGATVLALCRGAADPRLPAGDEPLAVGDTLCLAGTDEARSLAARLLRRGGVEGEGRSEAPEGAASV